MRPETEIFQGRAGAWDQTYKDNKTRFEISVKFWVCPQGSSLFKWLGNYSSNQDIANCNWIAWIIPVPPPKMFAYFNPILLNVDPLTVLWLNAFALNLQRSVKMLSVEQTDPPYLDAKIEAIMFRVSWFFSVDFFPSICFIPKHLELNASLKKLTKLWQF